MSEKNPNRRDALRSLGALALTGGAAPLALASVPPAVVPASAVEADDLDDWEYFVPPELLHPEIIVGLWLEQQRALPLYLLSRAREEVARLRVQGLKPRGMTGEDGVGHWVMEGRQWDEVAACGEDFESALNAEGQLVHGRQARVTCGGCLALLRRATRDMGA